MNAPDSGEHEAQIWGLWTHAYSWIPAYAFVWGGLTQWVSWRGFDVYVFDYVGLSDLLKFSFEPLVFFLPVLLVCSALIYVLPRPHEVFRKWRKQANIKPPRDWLRVLLVLAFLMISATGWWLGPTGHSPIDIGSWFLTLGTIISAALVLSPTFVPKLEGFSRVVLISAIGIGPAAAWIMASMRADNVLNREDYNLAILSSKQQEQLQIAPNLEVVFLGHIGDHDFFRADSKTIVVLSSDIGPIKYSREINLSESDKRFLRLLGK